MHIQNISAFGVILSTFELFKFINTHYPKLDQVIILEDDVYLIKEFNKYYQINKEELSQIDFMYLGHNSLNKELIEIRKKSKKYIIDQSLFKNINIYGAYSFICSKKYRAFVLNKGVDYLINNNINLDCFYLLNYRNNNNFNIKLHKHHLFIPEVRKEGIQKNRGIEFYIDRKIELNNYDIIN